MRPEILGEILPFALAAAPTPTAILAVLLLLLTPRARASGIAFLGGWALGLLFSAWILLRIGSEPGLLGTAVNEEALFRPLITFLAGLALIVSGSLGFRTARRATTEPG